MKTERIVRRPLTRMLLVLAALLCTATAAHADEYAVGKGSEVKFVAKITASSFTAETDKVSGSVSHDAASSTLSGGTIRVSAKQFETGMDLRDEHMRDKYLEAEKFPAIELVITGGTVQAKAGAKGTLEGRFVIKGKSKDVKLPVTVSEAKGGKLIVTSTFKLDIRDYGIPQPKFAVVKMEPVIEVTVELQLQSK